MKLLRGNENYIHPLTNKEEEERRCILRAGRKIASVKIPVIDFGEKSSPVPEKENSIVFV